MFERGEGRREKVRGRRYEGEGMREEVGGRRYEGEGRREKGEGTREESLTPNHSSLFPLPLKKNFKNPLAQVTGFLIYYVLVRHESELDL